MSKVINDYDEILKKMKKLDEKNNSFEDTADTIIDYANLQQDNIKNFNYDMSEEQEKEVYKNISNSIVRAIIVRNLGDISKQILNENQTEEQDISNSDLNDFEDLLKDLSEI